MPCIDNTVYVIMYIASCTCFIYGSISVNNPYNGLYQTFPLYWRKSKLDTFLQSLHLFETLVIGRSDGAANWEKRVKRLQLSLPPGKPVSECEIALDYGVRLPLSPRGT